CWSSLAAQRLRPPPPSPLFPYTTLFRSARADVDVVADHRRDFLLDAAEADGDAVPDPAIVADARVAADNDAAEMIDHEVAADLRSEEHTSELQSRENLVCRLLLEKKKND